MEKKTVTVVVPTYNEEKNVPLVYERVKRVFEEHLPEIQWELLFIDNDSTDHTRAAITKLAVQDDVVKAIFNARNFGFDRSVFYGILQAKGDCAVLIFADLQDPPEVIPAMVENWRQGSKIVVGIKNKSKESPLLYAFRGLYYKLLAKISESEHIPQYDGFGLYDRDFIRVLQQIRDPMPYFRGIVAELGFRRTEVYYEQDVRRFGKSKFNFMRMYDLAMLGITSYSKMAMRVATFTGAIIGGVSLLIAIYTFIEKLLFWNSFPLGTAAIAIGIYFFGGMILFFIGILGEYIANINIRVMDRPLVVEEKRINY